MEPTDNDDPMQHYYIKYTIVGRKRVNEYWTRLQYDNAKEAEDYLREKMRRSLKAEIEIIECRPVNVQSTGTTKIHQH